MQKVVPVGVPVHEYVSHPDRVLSPKHLHCPLCPKPHRLWRHGWYQRTAIIAGKEAPRRIPVVRLLCHVLGVTVSLLPDFCLPRRQHGPAVLGLFLEALVVTGLTLTAAMLRARPAAPQGHSLPQSLLAGFRRHLPRTRVWLARRRARASKPPDSPSRWPAEVRAAVAELLAVGKDAAAAFTRAGREVHDLTGVGLA